MFDRVWRRSRAKGRDIQIFWQYIAQQDPKSCVSTCVLEINGVLKRLVGFDAVVLSCSVWNSRFQVRIIRTDDLPAIKIVRQRPFFEPECGDLSGCEPVAVFEGGGRECAKALRGETAG